MSLLLFKSKYPQNCYLWQVLCCAIVVLSVSSIVRAKKCVDPNCSGNGVCKNDTCVCYDGWQGPQCQFCGGKVRLGASTGTITDGLGNYSLGVKCSWLIDAPNTNITLHLEEFATECGWDHLYIFDGDSVDSPLLAVFSGLMYKGEYNIRRIPEIVAYSGSALVHFFSDDAFNMSGFNMTYRLNACPSKVSGVDCSGNGICINELCTCNRGWTGAACHLPECPDNCGRHESRGRCEPEFGCRCESDYKGDDCSQFAPNGFWEMVKMGSFVPPGSASHGAVIWKNSMYIIAGESYVKRSMVYVYDFNSNKWETPHITSEAPSHRYGHSTVIYGDKIFLYGGVLGKRGPSSEVWAFDINAKTWENITVKAVACNSSVMCGPLKSAGHTATVIENPSNRKTDKMIVLFGHSPHLGYLNTVQEYFFGTREWHIVETRGYPVKGGYGHTASWDSLTAKIYVYGGVVSDNESAQFLSKSLYSYDPNTRVWNLLKDAPSARFLHTASFISGGLMLVFGGNTYDTLLSAKCYSSEFLAYDVTCNTWQVLQVPADIHADLARFGHSAVTFEGSLYIYGGFDGQMLSDMLRYTPGSCTSYITSNECLSKKPGVKCVWDMKNNFCTAIQNIPPKNLTSHDDGLIIRCPELNRTMITQSVAAPGAKPIRYKTVCSDFSSCLKCIKKECIWCQNEGRCVDKNAYTSSFPYGKCREYTILGSKCRKSGRNPKCSFYSTCAKCREDPACGWCDDGSKTGLGKCMPGGYASPNTYSLPSSTCPSDRWHFTTCPLCQCNGHASCVANTSTCLPCGNFTKGGQCERCLKGFWGNPINGGKCQACECNGQATRCHQKTGNCYCTTKGLIGDHCEKCDATNHFNSDPINKESCYYDLTIDYQFTFNLSKKEDRHFTQINFRNSPIKADIDADFSIQCSVLAKINITIQRRGNSKEEKPIFEDLNCTTFKTSFSKSEYNFGVEDNISLTTFYVYVYDLKPPLLIKIGFSQPPKLNLKQFFLTYNLAHLYQDPGFNLTQLIVFAQLAEFKKMT